MDHSTKTREIKLFNLTFNMGHMGCRLLKANGSELFKNAENCDVAAVALQECKRIAIPKIIQLFQDLMFKIDISLLSSVYMWEMLLLVFVKKNLWNAVSDVKKNCKPCGLGNFIGNKGGVSLSLNIFESPFHFIGCHLICGKAKPQKRTAMLRVRRLVFNVSIRV
jgi:hypothetical protein